MFYLPTKYLFGSKFFVSIQCLFHLMIIFRTANSLHLKGTFDTNDFFKFVTRFGFQATDMHDEYSTQGYIYGNISIIRKSNLFNRNMSDEVSLPNAFITLAVIDYNYFIDYYNKRRVKPRSSACAMMFEKIEKMAYFYECNERGREDFIRRVPCPNNGLCVDEDNKDNVLNGHQFTFRIRDLNQARFWYISFVSCTRNLQNCEWIDLSDYGKSLGTSMTPSASTSASQRSSPPPAFTIAYDIYLVNGNPKSKFKNQFEHHYSYELHDVFEIYLFSLIIYLFIMPFIIYRLRKHFHYLYLQLLIYISIEVTCRVLELIHNLVFSFDGRGVLLFDVLSNFLEALASSFLILILISIAKGWTVRTKRLKTNRNFYALGFVLQSVLVGSHMIALATIDPVFNTNSYETKAGYMELSIRFVCMFWFLIELKETFNNLEAAVFESHSSINHGNNNKRKESDEDSMREGDTRSSGEHQLIANGECSESEIDEDDDEGEEIKMNGKTYTSVPSGSNNNSKHFSSSDFFKVSKSERLRSLQKFYLHYGACSLVWFIYLPVLIFITSFVSELYRLRLVLSIRYFVNFISVVVLFYIMWSPKTPLKLPGKKPKIKSDLDQLYYINGQELANEDDNDSDILFSVQDLTANLKKP